MMNRTIQREHIKSSLTHTEYLVRGARSFLLLLLAGEGTLTQSEGQITALNAPSLVWGPVGRTASLRIEAGTRAEILRIPETLLGRAMPSGSVSGHLRHAIGGEVVASDLNPRMMSRLEMLLDQISEEIDGDLPGSSAVVEHSISLLLLQIWRSSNPKVESAAVLSSRMVHDFFSLAEVHLYEHLSVAEYANKLGVSKDRLTSAVRRAIDLSPHEYLQNRLMDEARKLLTRSDYTVADIGYRLGFPDPAYFNRFFKRNANNPPGSFRKQHVDESLSQQDRSTYAAWP